MRAAFGFGDVAAVVDWEKDVRCAGEVGEGVAEGERVGGLEEEEGHTRSEEDDVGRSVLCEEFVFEVSIVWTAQFFAVAAAAAKLAVTRSIDLLLPEGNYLDVSNVRC